MLSEIAGIATYGKFIGDCPLCFAVFGEKKQQFYLEDCCAATENLILALQAHGVSSCWVAGDKTPYAETVRKLLKVPDEYTLVSLVAAGNAADITITRKKDMKHIAFLKSSGRINFCSGEIHFFIIMIAPFAPALPPSGAGAHCDIHEVGYR